MFSRSLMRALPRAALLCTLLLPRLSSAHEADDPHGHARPSEHTPSTLDRVKTWLLTRPDDNAPNRLERLVLAAGTAGASVVGIGVASAFGVFGLLRPECADAPAQCELQAPTPDLNPAHQLAGRLAGDRHFLVGDMAFGVAIALAVIAVGALVTALWPDGLWPLSNT